MISTDISSQAGSSFFVFPLKEIKNLSQSTSVSSLSVASLLKTPSLCFQSLPSSFTTLSFD